MDNQLKKRKWRGRERERKSLINSKNLSISTFYQDVAMLVICMVETLGAKARWELHKDVGYCLKQIL